MKAKPEHVDDLAFQMHCLRLCKQKVRRAVVVHINNAFVRNGPVLPAKFFKSTDVTEEVFAKVNQVPINVATMLKALYGGSGGNTRLVRSATPCD
jgi:hypothetical protein